MPPRVVIAPHTKPRAQGWPRPVRLPSSDNASANPMLMPAPTLAARPMRKVGQLPCVAKGAAIDEAMHVLTPDERDVVAETGFVKFEQAMAVAVLLLAHVAELFRLLGIISLQAVGEIFVDARILLFERDCQGENFLFRQPF